MKPTLSMNSNHVMVRELKDYLMIALGMIFYGIGWTVFLLPNDLPSGAVPGIASIVYWGTGLPVQYTYFAINALLLLLSLKILGWKFSMKTVYAVFVLTFFLSVIQRLTSGLQLLEDFIKAQQLPVKPYEETVSNEPLIPELPAPGKIREMKTDPLFGATVLTLDNGIKVVLKHTDFKKDEILMTATSPGGSTLFGAKDIDNLKVFNDVITLGGPEVDNRRFRCFQSAFEDIRVFALADSRYFGGIGFFGTSFDRECRQILFYKRTDTVCVDISDERKDKV